MHSLGGGLLSARSILTRRVAFPLLFLGAGLMLAQPCAGGVFSETGSLTTARSGHTATLLLDGRVLVAGGSNGTSPLASAELYDPASGTWSPTGSLTTGRSGHTATLLPNGKALVAGGYNDSGGYLVSAELYDSANGTWTPSGDLATARENQTATLLPDGQVLVIGGSDGTTVLASAELYDPVSGTWTATGSLATARWGHTAILLPNGQVLVAGGFNFTSGYLTSAELYDPQSGTWTTTGSLAAAYYTHTATLLPNGQVLVAGGFNGTSGYLASAELYDSARGAWTVSASLTTARTGHTATLLPNGQVLVTGGYDGATSLASTELYDPTNGTWIAAASLATGRLDHTATLLSNGQVLVAGGLNPTNNDLASAELYDPATPVTTKLLNISTRLAVGIGDDVLIGGFIVTGNAPKKVLLRAIGPSLANAIPPVVGALADPTLELHEADGTVVTNDNWKDSQEQAISDTGIAPGNDLESAILATLAPGAYTAIVSGNNNGTGVALIEAYDLQPEADSKLANISSRGKVETGDDVIVGGFILGPEGLPNAKVVVRAIGPSLVDAGVAEALLDPTLELHDSSGNLIASDDNWRDDSAQEAQLEADGLAPTDDRESALDVTLVPGAYTAIVRGKDETSGVALVEVYSLETAVVCPQVQ